MTPYEVLIKPFYGSIVQTTLRILSDQEFSPAIPIVLEHHDVHLPTRRESSGQGIGVPFQPVDHRTGRVLSRSMDLERGTYQSQNPKLMVK